VGLGKLTDTLYRMYIPLKWLATSSFMVGSAGTDCAVKMYTSMCGCVVHVVSSSLFLACTYSAVEHSQVLLLLLLLLLVVVVSLGGAVACCVPQPAARLLACCVQQQWDCQGCRH
jgi:hypothetical protein